MIINWNDFHVYADIARQKEVKVDNPQEQIANAILQQGHGIESYSLAQKVFQDCGVTVYSEKEMAEIKKVIQALPTIWAVALKESLSII